MKLKHILFCLILFLTPDTFSQELNIGVNTGIQTDKVSSLVSSGGSYYLFLFGAAFEHRPAHAFFSINNDPFIFLNSKKLIFSDLIYFKFILGNKLRFCPTVGGFFRSNFRLGWLYGAQIEYDLKDRVILFINADFNKEYFKVNYPTHFNGSYFQYTSQTGFMLSFGIKKNFKFKAATD